MKGFLSLTALAVVCLFLEAAVEVAVVGFSGGASPFSGSVARILLATAADVYCVRGGLKFRLPVASINC